MTKKTYQVVILDNEWLIVKNDWEEVARKTTKRLEIPSMNGREYKHSLRLFDKADGSEGNPDNPLYQYNRGLITTDEFWGTVLTSPHYNLEPSSKNIAIMSEEMRGLTTEVDPDTVQCIEKMAEAGVPLYMLSNSLPEIYIGNRERHDYFRHFNHCSFSFETGFRKPELGSYIMLLERIKDDTGYGPEYCVFGDDKRENRWGARALGIHTINQKIDQGIKLEDQLRPLVKF